MIYRILLLAISLLFAVSGSATVIASDRQWMETGEEYEGKKQPNQIKLPLSKWISQSRSAYAPSARLAAVQLLRRLAEDYRDNLVSLTEAELASLQKGLTMLVRKSKSAAVISHAWAALVALHYR
jgi:hypothetical protein